MKKILIAGMIALFFLPLQAQFSIKAVANKNVCYWYVKNTGSDTLKLVSASMRFFHQTGGIIFTPSINIPGGGTYQYQGSFNASGKYTFKYKTIQIPALDSTLKPGDSALMSTTTNEGDFKDTIIITGVKIYYSKNSLPGSADAFPENVTPCPSEAVYISGGTSNSGIKLNSASTQNLHYGVCEQPLLAIVFDANTLKRKSVGNIMPHCSWGQKWISLGDVSDYQVYYTFDITTSLGQMQFDSFVEALNIGDYVAITNTQITALSSFNSVKNTLKKVGFSHSDFSSDPGYIAILGKKGALPGEASYNSCQDPHGVCNVSMEHSMTAKDFSNAIQDYSLCFEDYPQYLEPAPKNNSVHKNELQNIKIFPNPSSDFWHISGMKANYKLELFQYNGVRIPVQLANNSIDVNGLSAGVYIAIISDSDGNKITHQILMRN